MFFFDDRNKFNIFRKNKENNVKNSLQNRNRCEKICYRFQNKDEFELVLKAPCKQSTHNLHLNYREYKML